MTITQTTAELLFEFAKFLYCMEHDFPETPQDFCELLQEARLDLDLFCDYMNIIQITPDK